MKSPLNKHPGSITPPRLACAHLQCVWQLVDNTRWGFESRKALGRDWHWLRPEITTNTPASLDWFFSSISRRPRHTGQLLSALISAISPLSLIESVQGEKISYSSACWEDASCQMEKRNIPLLFLSFLLFPRLRRPFLTWAVNCRRWTYGKSESHFSWTEHESARKIALFL